MKGLDSKLGRFITGTVVGLYTLTHATAFAGKPSQSYVEYMNNAPKTVEEKTVPNYVGVKLNLPEPSYKEESPMQLAYTTNISTRSDISDTVENEEKKQEEKAPKKNSFWKVLLGIAAVLGIGYAVYAATDDDGSSSG